MYACACSSVCVPERACMWATDGLTEDGGMGGFKCVHVCACVFAREFIDARSDGQMDGWMDADRWIAGWMHGLTHARMR